MESKKYILLLLLCTAVTAGAREARKAMTQVNFSKVKVTDRFWSPRIENNALHTIPVCLDQIENKHPEL